MFFVSHCGELVQDRARGTILEGVSAVQQATKQAGQICTSYKHSLFKQIFVAFALPPTHHSYIQQGSIAREALLRQVGVRTETSQSPVALGRTSLANVQAYGLAVSMDKFMADPIRGAG